MEEQQQASEPVIPVRQNKGTGAGVADLELSCMVCLKNIPQELAVKKAVTCSSECRDKRNQYLRKLRVDDKKCRFCHKPSTNTARAAFKRFIAWEVANPELAYPGTWQVLSSRGITIEQFRAAAAEAEAQDFSMELNPAALRWARFPKPNKPHENVEACFNVLRDYWRERGEA